MVRAGNFIRQIFMKKSSPKSSFVPLMLVLISLFSILQWGVTVKIEQLVVAESVELLNLDEPQFSKILSSQQNDIAEQIIDFLETKQKEKLIAEQTAKVHSFFVRYNSPLVGYEEIIVRKSAECGGDYAVLVGIAGNESGLGKIPYKKYNPYGYLDGIEYSGWEESLNKLSCVISQRFIAPCNGDLTCIINKYAGPADDKDLWIKNVTWFINQVR